jgi:hypothetical protein
MISPEPPANYEVIGQAKGGATGIMLFWLPPYNVIPAALNSRVARAYDRALKSVPGATGLVNVTIQESWAWAVFGTLRGTIITGDAIKEK